MIRYGMAGGGCGSFIGDVHRSAIALDGKAQLVVPPSQDIPIIQWKQEKHLDIDLRRLYTTYEEMVEKEAQREDGIDFVSIVTPNYLHYPVAKKFLEEGIHIVCDKPVTTESRQAEELHRIAREKGLLFCVT